MEIVPAPGEVVLSKDKLLVMSSGAGSALAEGPRLKGGAESSWLCFREHGKNCLQTH